MHCESSAPVQFHSSVAVQYQETACHTTDRTVTAAAMSPHYDTRQHRDALHFHSYIVQSTPQAESIRLYHHHKLQYSLRITCLRIYFHSFGSIAFPPNPLCFQLSFDLSNDVTCKICHGFDFFKERYTFFKGTHCLLCVKSPESPRKILSLFSSYKNNVT